MKDVQSKSTPGGKDYAECGNLASFEGALENQRGTVFLFVYVSAVSKWQFSQMKIKVTNWDLGTKEKVPSPFKRNYYWPEQVKTKSKRKPKEKVPSVVTSGEWNRYFNQKGTEKA